MRFDIVSALGLAIFLLPVLSLTQAEITSQPVNQQPTTQLSAQNETHSCLVHGGYAFTQQCPSLQAHFREKSEILSTDQSTEATKMAIPEEELKFVGGWDSLNQTKVEWFKFLGGNSQFFVRQDLSTINAWLYDGKYNDQNALKLEIAFEDQDFNTEERTISSERAHLTINFINEYEIIEKNEACTASYHVKFMNSTEGRLGDHFVNVSFVLHSANCNLHISGMYTDSDKKGASNAMVYTVFVTALCCLHICACIQFIKDVRNNPSEASKYSLATISFFLCWDIALGFYHLYNSMQNPQYFQFFIMPAFWFMTLSTIFEARVLICVWRLRRRLNNQTFDIRANLYRAYLTMLLPILMSVSHFEKIKDGLLLILMMLAHYFLYKNWCLLLSGLFFLPQIIHNAVEDHNFPRDYNYVLGLGLSRILIPLYARGYSNNVFLLTPDLTFCACYATISLTQIGVLLLQARLGSRFFIPRRLRPKPFDYYLDETSENYIVYKDEDSCSICIQKYTDFPEGSDDKLNRLMRTPCQHIFHEGCLKKWMKIKLECPFCKSSIPPYI